MRSGRLFPAANLAALSATMGEGGFAQCPPVCAIYWLVSRVIAWPMNYACDCDKRLPLYHEGNVPIEFLFFIGVQSSEPSKCTAFHANWVRVKRIRYLPLLADGVVWEQECGDILRLEKDPAESKTVHPNVVWVGHMIRQP